MPRKVRSAARINFAEFTEAVTAALLRAGEARKRPFGPILIGIIWWPEGLEPGPLRGQVGGPLATRAGGGARKG